MNALAIADHGGVSVVEGCSDRICTCCGAMSVSPHTAMNRRTMVAPTSKELFILGITRQGKMFRPSDWAERLAGVMSTFHPGGAMPGSHLRYSPWCIPTSIGQAKCVIVHSDLRDYDVMAWNFCVNFAKDNDLQVSDVRPESPTSGG
jgi:hypothetical protein